VVSLGVCQSIGAEFAAEMTKAPGFASDDDTDEWETIFDDSMIMASESGASMAAPAPEEPQPTEAASSLSPQTSCHPVAEITTQSPDAKVLVNVLPEGTQTPPPLSNSEDSLAMVTKSDLDVEPSAPVSAEAPPSVAVSSQLLDKVCSPVTDLEGQSPDLEFFFDAPSVEVGPNEQEADGSVTTTSDTDADADVTADVPQQSIPEVSSVSTPSRCCTPLQDASVQPPKVHSPIDAIPESPLSTINVESEAETDSTIDYTSVPPRDVRDKESPTIGHETEADVTIDYPGEPDLADDEAEVDAGYVSEDFVYFGATGNEPVDLPHETEQISERVGGTKDEASSPKGGAISDLELSQSPGDMSNITSMSAKSGDPGSPDSQDTILFPELPSGMLSPASDNSSSSNEERREPLIVTKLKGKAPRGRKLSLDKQASQRLIYDGLGVSRAQQSRVEAPATVATEGLPVDPLSARISFAMRHLEILKRLRESRGRDENRTFETGRLHPSESASSWRRSATHGHKEDVAGNLRASLSTFVPIPTRVGSSSSEATASTSANASMSAFPSITSAAGVDPAVIFPANPMWKDNATFTRAFDSPPSTAPSSYPSSASSSAFVFPLPARKERRDVAVSTSDFDAFLSTAAAPYAPYAFPPGPILPESIQRQPVQEPIRKQQQPVWTPSWRTPVSKDAPALKEREHVRRGGRRPKRSLDAETAEFYREGGDDKVEKDKSGNKRQRVIMYL
jgi:hypothetical protein